MEDECNLVRAAEKSLLRYRHGAGLYDSRGNPICYAHNIRYQGWGKRSLHAEEAVIAKFLRAYKPRGWKPVTLRVVRVNASGKLKNSKPCDHCARLIEEAGLKVEHS